MSAMDPTISTAVISSAEKIINVALNYDPATRIALAKLEPQVLAVRLTTPNLAIYIAPRADGIHILGHHEGDITTELQGSAPALMTLLKSDRINLKDSGVQVMGSTHFLAEFQKILKMLDIDWEEMLTQILGDVVGHQSAELIRSKFGWAKDRVSNIQRLTSEFLTEELKALPSKAELTFFNQQVDEIQLDVERMEARIHKLSQKSLKTL